jgi:hypothetical protein
LLQKGNLEPVNFDVLGVSYIMPFVLTTEAAKDPKREAQIVAYYRSGMTRNQIAEIYKISAERVRQLLARYQSREGIRLEINKPNYTTKHIQWTCAKCGLVREVIPSLAKSEMCAKCRRRYPVGAFSDELIESWIIQRRQGASWGAIAKKEGYKPNFYSAIPYAIYAYLRRQDRLAEAQVLWHGYSTRWLARKFPEDAAILLSNTRDGVSLKNRGYRSK